MHHSASQAVSTGRGTVKIQNVFTIVSLLQGLHQAFWSPWRPSFASRLDFCSQMDPLAHGVAKKSLIDDKNAGASACELFSLSSILKDWWPSHAGGRHP